LIFSGSSWSSKKIWKISTSKWRKIFGNVNRRSLWFSTRVISYFILFYFILSSNILLNSFIYHFRAISIDTQAAAPPTKYTNAPSLDPIEAGCGPKPW